MERCRSRDTGYLRHPRQSANEAAFGGRFGEAGLSSDAAAVRAAVEQGWTGTHELYADEVELADLRALDDAGELPLRVDAYLPMNSAARLSPGTARQLRSWSKRHRQQVPIEVLAIWLDLFVRLHGLVSMEVFGLLRPITPDVAPYAVEVFDAELAALVRPRRS